MAILSRQPFYPTPTGQPIGYNLPPTRYAPGALNAGFNMRPSPLAPTKLPNVLSSPNKTTPPRTTTNSNFQSQNVQISNTQPVAPGGGGQGGGRTQGFTQALMDILKNAQQGQQAGQAGLMQQHQNITGTGLDQANLVGSSMGQINPNDIVGLRQGAIGAVRPGELSVENQIRLSNSGFANVNDLIEKTLGSYEKEQDRQSRAREQAAEQAFRERQLAETMRSNRAGEAAGLGSLGIGGTGTQEGPRITSAQDVRTTIGAIKGYVAKLRGGTSFTPNEEKLLNTYTPDVNDTDTQIESKLKGLLNMMNTKSATIRSFGGKLSAAQENDLVDIAVLSQQVNDLYSAAERSGGKFIGAGPLMPILGRIGTGLFGATRQIDGGQTQPQTMMLGGQTLYLQADGTYQ